MLPSEYYKKILYLPVILAVFVTAFVNRTDNGIVRSTIAFGYGGGGSEEVAITGGGVWTGGSEGMISRSMSQSSFNVPLTVTNFQEGNLVYNINGGNILKIKVPIGSVPSKTTFFFTKKSVSEFSLQKESAVLIGGFVFDITAKDVNGNFVTRLNKDLTITLISPDIFLADAQNLGVYYFDGFKWMKINNNTSFDAGKVVFNADHLTSFAVFKVVGAPDVVNIEAPIGGETISIGQVLGASIFKFNKNLTVGMISADVAELQKRLIAEKVYFGQVTGSFDQSVKTGVKKYQAKYGIVQTGFVGPITRGKLNGGKVQGASTQKSGGVIEIKKVITPKSEIKVNNDNATSSLDFEKQNASSSVPEILETKSDSKSAGTVKKSSARLVDFLKNLFGR